MVHMNVRLVEAKNKKQENGRKSQKYCGYNDRIVLKYVKK